MVSNAARTVGARQCAAGSETRCGARGPAVIARSARPRASISMVGAVAVPIGVQVPDVAYVSAATQGDARRG